MHAKTSGGSGPASIPPPPWLAGAMVGMTILGMAGSAIVLGAGLAMSQATCRGK